MVKKIKREQDWNVIYDMAKDVSAIKVSVATVCTTVAVHDKDLNGNGTGGLKRRTTWLERIVWTTIGGGTVAIFVLKVFLKW